MKKCIANIVYVLFFITAAVSALSFAFSMEILTFMKSPPGIIELANDYIELIYLGMIATAVYNLCAGLLRAVGDSRSPLIFLMISAVLNVILNYVLIAIIPLGVRGAALATVLAQMFSGICCIVFIVKKCKLLCFSTDHMKPNGRLIRQICAMGLPMGFQYSITAIGSVTLQSAINSLGSLTVTAYAAAEKILTPCWQILNCACVAIANFCSQNLGAGNLRRVKKGFRDGGLFILGASAVISLTLFFFGPQASLVFLDEYNAEIESCIAVYYGILAPLFPLLALVGIFRNTVQGLGFSLPAMFSGALELVARCTLALVFVPVYGYAAACFASPVAWFMADCLLIPLYFYAINKLSKKHPDWCEKPI